MGAVLELERCVVQSPFGSLAEWLGQVAVPLVETPSDARSTIRKLYARLAQEYDAMPRPQHHSHDPLGEIAL